MRLALWLAVAAAPLAAQPKLLVNAQLDTRSAAAGLEREFQALTAAQPQPAWIGYTAPLLPGSSLGCELVSPNGWWAPGVVHLEPPDRMVVLFRVESNAVERVRTLSPDCEIDAGGAPLHWLTDVKPAESVALLAGMARDPGRTGGSAVTVIALHADPAAYDALRGLAAPSQPESLRERAISGLRVSQAPAATDLLISIARGDGNARMRSQAVSALARKSAPKALDAILAAIGDDADVQVRRSGVSALQSLPGAAGIPLLIQTVNNNRNAEVRRQAMSYLSHSRDPRAVGFLEDILKK